MKYIISIMQYVWFLLADSILFIYHLKWGLYLEERMGWTFKKKNGIVFHAGNKDKSDHIPCNKNKYQALIHLK